MNSELGILPSEKTSIHQGSGKWLSGGLLGTFTQALYKRNLVSCVTAAPSRSQLDKAYSRLQNTHTKHIRKPRVGEGVKRYASGKLYLRELALWWLLPLICTDPCTEGESRSWCTPRRALELWLFHLLTADIGEIFPGWETLFFAMLKFQVAVEVCVCLSSHCWWESRYKNKAVAIGTAVKQIKPDVL